MKFSFANGVVSSAQCYKKFTAVRSML